MLAPTCAHMQGRMCAVPSNIITQTHKDELEWRQASVSAFLRSYHSSSHTPISIRSGIDRAVLSRTIRVVSLLYLMAFGAARPPTIISQACTVHFMSRTDSLALCWNHDNINISDIVQMCRLFCFSS